MNKPLIQARSLAKSYVMGREPLHVLRDASIAVAAGEFVAVMGSSGSGKSTLMHILGALDVPDSGRVVFDGRDLFSLGWRERERVRNTEIGFVFQFYHLLPELNVLENTLLPWMVHHSVTSWLSAVGEAKQTARKVLADVGLEERLKHRPNELSGGERQRAAIARAIAMRPRLLLADEPTGNLDAKTSGEILELLLKLNSEGQTIVMVTHDAGVGKRADRVVELKSGMLQ